MKICPACSEEVKDDAKKCPHCHFLIAPDSDVFAEPAPAKTITLTLDNNLIRVGGLAVAVFAMFVVVGVALYGLDLRNARNELHGIQLMNTKIQMAKENLDSDIRTMKENLDSYATRANRMLTQFKTRADEIEALKSRIERQSDQVTAKMNEVSGIAENMSSGLKQVSDRFERRIGGDKDGSGVADLDTLDSALQQSKTNSARLDGVEKAITTIKRQIVQINSNTPVELRNTRRALGVEELTANEMTKIKNAIKIRQTSRASNPPRGRESEGRDWHALTFSVFVDPDGNDERRILGLIEKVIYHFNKRWWKDPSKVVINRFENYSYTVSVWGRTSIDVEVFVKGFDEPLTTRVAMILEDNSVKDFDVE